MEWREQELTVDGRQSPYREAGEGEAVLLLEPSGVGEVGSAIEQLGHTYRLIATELSADSAETGAPSHREAARSVAQFVAALGVKRLAVIGRGAATSVALWLAIDEPALVATLVLESPPPLTPGTSLGDADPELLPAFGALEVPTLVVLGERAGPEALAKLSVYKRLPASTLALVYGAGEDVRGDRPSAYLTAVEEYLELGQAFIVSTESTVIHA